MDGLTERQLVIYNRREDYDKVSFLFSERINDMTKFCVKKNYNIVSVQSLIEMVKTLKKCGVKFKTIPLKLKLSDSYILNLVKLLIQNKLLDEKNMNAVNFADDVLQMCIKNKKCYCGY